MIEMRDKRQSLKCKILFGYVIIGLLILFAKLVLRFRGNDIWINKIWLDKELSL